MIEEPRTFAIVGIGPRGFSVLERFCSNIGYLYAGHRIDIHIVETIEPDPGTVSRTKKSHDRLMNTVASQINLFTDPNVEYDGSAVGPNLYEWARFLVLMGPLESYAPWILAAAYDLEPGSYPSRAFYCEYLAWVLRRLMRTVPATVRVEVHHARVTRLSEGPAGKQEIHLEGMPAPLLVDGVVLALVHVSMEPTDNERHVRDFADPHAVHHVPSARSADVDVSAVAPRESVILRSIGSSLFDCC